MTFLRLLPRRRRREEDVGGAGNDDEDEHAGAQSGDGGVDDQRNGNVAVADGVLDERERVVMSVGLSLSRALGAEPEVPKLSVGTAN